MSKHLFRRDDYVKSLDRPHFDCWPQDVTHCDRDDPPDCDCAWCNWVMAQRAATLPAAYRSA